jgi:hypothetical protein
VNRRLRLALFVVALVAAGPSAAPARAFATVRAEVSIAWLRGERASKPQVRRTGSEAPARSTNRIGPAAHPDPFRSGTLHSHPLFQRPPPLSI